MAHHETHRKLHKRSLRIAFGAMTALAALSAPLALEASAGAATNQDPPLTPSDIPKRNAPALDLVVASAKGTVTLYQVQLSAGAVRYIQSDPSIAQRMRSDAAGTIDAILDQMAKNQRDFFVKGASLGYVSEEMTGTGSAWNVTPDGVMVTNAHVAEMSSDLVHAAVERDGAAAVARVADSVSSQLAGARYGMSLSPAQRKTLQQIVANVITGSADVSNYTSSITVYPDHSKGTSLEAKVVKIGEGFPGKDVAILKADAKNVPVIAVDDDTKTATGDTVFALGYPFDATFDARVIKTTSISATLSKGNVSNRLQSSAADYKYIEHTASINHGSSGGVLVNERGRAVGITTAIDSSLQKQGAGNGGQFFYAVPMSVVKEFLDKAGVKPSMSQDQELFDQAVALMTNDAPAQDLAKAKDLLSKAKANGYTTPHLDELLQQLPTTTTATTDVSPVPPPVPQPHPVSHHHGVNVWQLVGGGMVALLTLAVLLLLLGRRSTKPNGSPSAPVTPPGPFGNGPSWPGQTVAGGTPMNPQQPWPPLPSPAAQCQPTQQPWFQSPPAPASTPAPSWFQQQPAPVGTTAGANPQVTSPSGKVDWWAQGGLGGNGQ